MTEPKKHGHSSGVHSGWGSNEEEIHKAIEEHEKESIGHDQVIKA